MCCILYNAQRLYNTSKPKTGGKVGGGLFTISHHSLERTVHNLGGAFFVTIHFVTVYADCIHAGRMTHNGLQAVQRHVGFVHGYERVPQFMHAAFNAVLLCVGSP